MMCEDHVREAIFVAQIMQWLHQADSCIMPEYYWYKLVIKPEIC